jgi:sulfite exporter TauE/SafE
MNRKPLLIVGIILMAIGGIFTLVTSVLRASNAKLGTAGFDGDSSILAGAIVLLVGLALTIYATARKIDLGPVEIEGVDTTEKSEESDAGKTETKP